MSNTQIWVFGILGFIVLYTLARGLTRQPSAMPWRVAIREQRKERENFEKFYESSLETQRQLAREVAALRQDATDIKTRLDSIENLLKSVRTY